MDLTASQKPGRDRRSSLVSESPPNFHIMLNRKEIAAGVVKKSGGGRGRRAGASYKAITKRGLWPEKFIFCPDSILLSEPQLCKESPNVALHCLHFRIFARHTRSRS
jgi:hypothetical protein